jgi:lysophospholipase L1-like esterase
MDSSLVHSRLKTIVFSLIPVAVLLLVLEAAGRWLYPFDPDRRALQNARQDPRVTLSYFNNGPGAQAILWDVGRMERRYLSFLGFLGKPGTTLPTLGTNQLGFRDDPLAPRQPGEVRILVLGGSTSWGVGASSNDATVRGVMQRLLNARGGTRYRVMSGAFLGYTSRQEMTVLTGLRDEFDPDIVVSLTGFNDVSTMIDDTGGVLERPEAQMLADAVTHHLRPMDTLTAVRKVVGSLGVWRLVVYFKERTGLAGPRPWDVKFDADRSRRRAAQVADLQRINAEYSARHGKRYIIAMQPDLYSTKKRLTPEEVATMKRFTSVARGIEAAHTNYRRDLAASLATVPNATFLDLRDRFDAVEEPLFIDSCHLVDRGYELIAEAIVRAID